MTDFIHSWNPFDLLLKDNRTIREDIFLYINFIALIIIIYQILMRILDKFFTPSSTAEIYSRRKIARNLAVFVSLLAGIPVIYNRIEYLPAILAITGAGIMVSLKEILLNFVGYFLIHGKNGFRLGDRIEIDKIRGDVLNIGIMRFTLLEVDGAHNNFQSTNRFVQIPNYNAVIYKVFVISSELEFVWDEIQIFLSVDSDWKLAEQICLKTLQNHDVLDPDYLNMDEKIWDLSKNYFFKIGKTTPIVYIQIYEGKIEFSLRYLTKSQKRRQHRDRISRKLLEEFARAKKVYLA